VADWHSVLPGWGGTGCGGSVAGVGRWIGGDGRWEGYCGYGAMERGEWEGVKCGCGAEDRVGSGESAVGSEKG